MRVELELDRADLELLVAILKHRVMHTRCARTFQLASQIERASKAVGDSSDDH